MVLTNRNRLYYKRETKYGIHCAQNEEQVGDQLDTLIFAKCDIITIKKIYGTE